MTIAERLMLLLIPLAYLLGSIPFGLIVGLRKGVDPRLAGSGNIGATNVGRLLGAKYFGYVFTLDLLKALLPTAVASWVAIHYGAGEGAGAGAGNPRPGLLLVLHLLVGFSAIFGHMFSLFLGFKGGKGVACGAGVTLGLYPYFTVPGLCVLALWGGIYGATRYVSLASILAALAFPLFFLAIGLWQHWPIFGSHLPLLIFASLIACLVVVRHRSNIRRLCAGTESRFTGKAD